MLPALEVQSLSLRNSRDISAAYVLLDGSPRALLWPITNSRGDRGPVQAQPRGGRLVSRSSVSEALPAATVLWASTPREGSEPPTLGQAGAWQDSAAAGFVRLRQ